MSRNEWNLTLETCMILNWLHYKSVIIDRSFSNRRESSKKKANAKVTEEIDSPKREEGRKRKKKGESTLSRALNRRNKEEKREEGRKEKIKRDKNKASAGLWLWRTKDSRPADRRQFLKSVHSFARASGRRDKTAEQPVKSFCMAADEDGDEDEVFSFSLLSHSRFHRLLSSVLSFFKIKIQRLRASTTLAKLSTDWRQQSHPRGARQFPCLANATAGFLFFPPAYQPFGSIRRRNTSASSTHCSLLTQLFVRVGSFPGGSKSFSRDEREKLFKQFPGSFVISPIICRLGRQWIKLNGERYISWPGDSTTNCAVRQPISRRVGWPAITKREQVAALAGS